MRNAKDEFEEELKREYCTFCQSEDLKVTRIIKIECRKCGKTRLITARIG